MRKLRYTFICPLCRKRFANDEPGEPLCTGPSESRDEHEMTVMLLERIERTDVSPEVALRRASGRLLLPEDETYLEAEANLLISS